MDVEQIEQAVDKAVNKRVNGSIVKLQEMMKQHIAQHAVIDKQLQEHMRRVEPVIGAFEKERAFSEQARAYGKNIIFWTRVVTAATVLGGAWLYLEGKIKT